MIEKMKYSNRHDEKPFIIEGEPRDNKELPDIDIDDIDIIFKEGERVNIETDQDVIEEEDTPRTSLI